MNMDPGREYCKTGITYWKQFNFKGLTEKMFLMLNLVFPIIWTDTNQGFKKCACT